MTGRVKPADRVAGWIGIGVICFCALMGFIYS